MKKKLGEILSEAGAVRPEDLAEALEAQSAGDPSRLGDLLVATGKVTTVDMAKALAVQFGLPFVQLEQVSPEVAALVPIEFQTLHGLVPFKDEGARAGIHVAVADPSTKDLLAELEFQIGRKLIVSIASPDEIAAVHAALQGDVVQAVIVEDDPPTVPITIPAPVPSPSKTASLGRVALKRVAVNTVTGEQSVVKVPSFAADVPPLELSPPRPAARTRPTSGTAEVPAPVPPPPDVTAPVVAAVVAAGLPARAKRPVKTEPYAPPVLKPAGVPDPTASPKRPKPITGAKKAVASAPAVAPAIAPSVPPPSSDDWSVHEIHQPAPSVTAEIPQAEPEPIAATIRSKVRTDIDFAKAAATPMPEATSPAASPLTDLPAWMREGAVSTGGADALTTAVEKAVLVGGAPRTVARVLRLLVDRGLLTERELLDELEKP